MQLLKSSADVFCLQEVWHAEQQREIYDGVKSVYPHIASTINSPCSPKNVYEVLLCAMEECMNEIEASCVKDNCQDTSDIPCIANVCLFEEEVQLCFKSNCHDTFTSLPLRCISCLFVYGRGLFCLSSDAPYQQTLGLMLLSKFELTDVRLQSYAPKGDDHGAAGGFIQANVRFLPCTSLFCLCIHMQKRFDNLVLAELRGRKLVYERQ